MKKIGLYITLVQWALCGGFYLHASGCLDLAWVGQLVGDGDVFHPSVKGAHHRASLDVVDVRREVAGDRDPPKFGHLRRGYRIQRVGYKRLVRVEDVHIPENVRHDVVGHKVVTYLYHECIGKSVDECATIVCLALMASDGVQPRLYNGIEWRHLWVKCVHNIRHVFGHIRIPKTTVGSHLMPWKREICGHWMDNVIPKHRT